MSVRSTDGDSAAAADAKDSGSIGRMPSKLDPALLREPRVVHGTPRPELGVKRVRRKELPNNGAGAKNFKLCSGSGSGGGSGNIDTDENAMPTSTGLVVGTRVGAGTGAGAGGIGLGLKLMDRPRSNLGQGYGFGHVGRTRSLGATEMLR